jgi:hypothetical protein
MRRGMAADGCDGPRGPQRQRITTHWLPAQRPARQHTRCRAGQEQHTHNSDRALEAGRRGTRNDRRAASECGT